MYAFAPEKPPSLVGRNFCLAIVRVFAKASNMKPVHRLVGTCRLSCENKFLIPSGVDRGD
jgi:hypothetical protein